MKCLECKARMIDYLYQELSSEEKREMEGHFKTCEGCATQLSQFQLVRTSFAQLKHEELPSLVHQKVLAHAREIALQKRGSWLAQIFFKPATATIMVVLLTVGIFYYTRQFIPLAVNTGKQVQGERMEVVEKDQIGEVRPMAPGPFPERRAEISSQVTLSPDRNQESEMLVEKNPAYIALSSPPSVLGDRGAALEESNILTRMARGPDEGAAGRRDSSLPSRDVLYEFELGNHYFSQNEFEKAIATYSLALMMHPQGAYADTIRYQLAISYKKLNDCNSAVKVLDEIQKRYPNYPEIDKVILMAGDCYMDLHAYDKAENNYANFVRRYPERESQVAEKLETARKFRRVNLTY